MWPRIVELMLGLWLAASPLIFGVSDLSGFASMNAFLCGLIVVIASCLAYWEPTRHSRGLTAAVGIWLAARAYVTAPHPAPPEVQNEFLLGLLFLMFAILPNDAGRPPRSWRAFVKTDRDPPGSRGIQAGR